MIAVVDYGMGNLRNVRRALQEIGADALVTSDPADVRRASSLILPGVGAFGEAVKRIDSLGLRSPILEHVQAARPLLGICLGMQLLFPHSEESPGAQGLGLLDGTVCRFQGDLPIPHIGWNDAVPIRPSILFGEEGGCFYFVHSFFAAVDAWTIAQTEYGQVFASAAQRENVFGVQFHPEKSQTAGLELLRRYLERDDQSVKREA